MGFNLIIILSALILTVGCMKKPSEDVDYGPEVNVNSIADAISDATGPYAPDQIKKLESSQVDYTRQIHGKTTIDLLKRTTTLVKDRALKNNQIQFTFNTIETYYDPTGELPPDITETDSNECVNVTTLEPENCSVATLGTKPNAPAKKLGTMSNSPEVRLYASNSGKDKTYHNLNVSRSIIAPPDKVKDLSNCGGLANCEMHAIVIQYDVVFWTELEAGQKFAVKRTFSPDSPYLSREIENCITGAIPVPKPGQDPASAPRLLLTECNRVEDFRSGETTP